MQTSEFSYSLDRSHWPVVDRRETGRTQRLKKGKKKKKNPQKNFRALDFHDREKKRKKKKKHENGQARKTGGKRHNEINWYDSSCTSYKLRSSEPAGHTLASNLKQKLKTEIIIFVQV